MSKRDADAPPRPAKSAERALSASDVLRKPVNTLAIVPKSARITSLGRKSYNVLLYEAQEQGLERDVFKAPLERIIKGVDFDSNDHALVKKHLRAMVSTTVEWQSPTTGEGASWNVSGLLAHAKLNKVNGQVWVEWSYAVNLKQELLQPTVFARLRLEVISQLRSHAAIALYEICMRYREVARTSRQPWRWWIPVLTGQPETERTSTIEYRIFKRDTLKPAIAEVSSLTDLDIELIEHKLGRSISEIQFGIKTRRQTSLPLAHRPDAVDLTLVTRAKAMGVPEDKAEDLIAEYGNQVVAAGLETLARRQASAFPEPLRDAYRYLKSLMPSEADKLEQQQGQAESEQVAAAAAAPAKRKAMWMEEWIRRRRQYVIDSIRQQSPEEQDRLAELLRQDMEARKVHPSILKRLVTSGWQHPMVLSEMVRFYAVGSIGADWDRPQPEDLLAIASELGDAA
jgi:hypothetical protein